MTTRSQQLAAFVEMVSRLERHAPSDADVSVNFRDDWGRIVVERDFGSDDEDDGESDETDAAGEGGTVGVDHPTTDVVQSVADSLTDDIEEAAAAVIEDDESGDEQEAEDLPHGTTD